MIFKKNTHINVYPILFLFKKKQFLMTQVNDLGLPTRNYILISVPKSRGTVNLDPFRSVNQVTQFENKLSKANFKWNIPDLKVGTMDALYSLLDDLNKYDNYIESVLRKIGRQRLDITKKKDRPDVKFLINNSGKLNFSQKS